jgi:hypothetical protein
VMRDARGAGRASSGVRERGARNLVHF